MRAIRILLLLLFAAGPAPVPAPAAASGGLVLEPGEPLTAEHLDHLLAGRLPIPGGGARLTVDWIAPSLPLANPAGVPTHIAVTAFERDAASGRVTVELHARLATGEATTLRLVGFQRRLVAVPVPVQPIASGTVLTPDMLESIWMAEARLPPGTVRRTDRAVGLEARRRLAAGRPIAERDLTAPRLVRRGEPVTMVYRVPGLEVVGLGKALEDGTLGDPVRLLNPDSRLTVRGLVTGRRRVAVVGGAP